jgi:hypothetical protein
MSYSLKPFVLEERIAEFVRSVLGVTDVDVVERIQSLWGEQGQILRLRTNSNSHPTCVLKHICLNSQAHHPRGWNTSVSFQRKVTSYEVERCWYERYADDCDVACKVPQLLGTKTQNGDSLILLEDLSDAYPVRCGHLAVDKVKVCLEWLAHFHARFLGNAGQGLWPEGCYWHLSTRADEYAALPEGPVKQAAKLLDAKVANFCFSPTLDSVAGVDFQYVGKGCGIKDVVYFLGSCLTEAECAENESALLDVYFKALNYALGDKLPMQEIQQLESEWRSLYGIAWTDFYRFLLGWMPTHQKINSYTVSLCERTLSDL